MDSISQGNGVATSSNDVWSTINKGIDAVTAFALQRGTQSQTQATPTGTISGGAWNPFPATQSPFPQAQSKAQFDAGGISFGVSWLMLGIVALAAFLLLRK